MPLIAPRLTDRKGYRRGRAFREDHAGATAIEFGIVMVPFFFFVLLIMQVGLFHFSLHSLDFAVRQAGRAVMTGQATATSNAAAFKTAYVCPKVFFAMECAKVTLNAFTVGRSSDATASTGVYSYINSTTKQLNAPISDPAKQSFCLGGPGDYVLIDISYPYPNFVRRLLPNTSGDPWMMRSTTMVFNEPNAKGGGTC